MSREWRTRQYRNIFSNYRQTIGEYDVVVIMAFIAVTCRTAAAIHDNQKGHEVLPDGQCGI